MLRILDPKAGPVIGKLVLAPRFGTLNGLKIGVLWNGRTYGGNLLRKIIEVLKEKYRLEVVAFLQKAYVGNIAPKEFFDQLVAKKADAVIVGVGD